MIITLFTSNSEETVSIPIAGKGLRFKTAFLPFGGKSSFRYSTREPFVQARPFCHPSSLR
jgi:hypothetical protein